MFREKRPLYTADCEECSQTLAANTETILGYVKAFHYWDEHPDEFESDAEDALTMVEHVDEALAAQLNDVKKTEVDREEIDDLLDASQTDIKDDLAIEDSEIDTAAQGIGSIEWHVDDADVSLDLAIERYEDEAWVRVSMTPDVPGNPTVDCTFHHPEELLIFSRRLKRAAQKITPNEGEQ